MSLRAATVVVGALVALPCSAAPATVPLADFRCGAPLDASIDFRITYGPHWDGAWRVTAVRGDADEPPHLVFESLEVSPASHVATVAAHHSRAAGGRNLGALRRASGVMIAEMQRLAAREETPPTHDQRRPFTVQVNGSLGVQCADGYANWPRLPGTYYFSAVELVADWVQHPAGRDPWDAVQLQLQQVRAPWQ